MPGYDLNVVQGSNYYLTLIVNDNGNPLNLNNYQFSGFYRNSFSSSNPTNLNVSGLIPASGVINLYISPENTALMPVGIGVYDIKFTDHSGNSFKALFGNVYVYPQVTY